MTERAIPDDLAQLEAHAAEVGGEYVLVYGSAELGDLRELVELLTTDPVGR